MSGFNSGAIDPALLSSNGTGGSISPAQLLNNWAAPASQPSTSLSAASPAVINPQSNTSATQAASLPPTNNPFSLSAPLPASNSGTAINHSSIASALPAHLHPSYPPSLSSPIIPPASLAGTSAAVAPVVNGASPSSSNQVASDPFSSNGMSLKEQEMHQKDQELAQFLLKMDDYKPIIPDEVAAYYLQRVGFECTDVRVRRLLALACQKFVSDIAQDAFGYARTRTGQAPGGRQGGMASNATSTNLPNGAPAGTSTRKDRTRTVLTQEDLAQALSEYGINASRAPYYL